MPGKVKVKILSGRNLPVMDRGSDTTDAYVEIKLASIIHKTDVCRKSLNPVWNSDWYRFEVDDAELQDEPLQIRLMDYDTYSANDAIGKVYISLNPLLHPALDNTQASSHISVMSGWIPVYDTMNGVRGEVNLIVKVDLFSDVNKFRQSSCGVKFFHSPIIPHGYHAQIIHGFVEELVVNDDPEYQWIDKIRTPRASNEARQIAFIKLSGQVQRKIGLKAIDMGANAVLGYTQCFDLEGDVGVVARGIGTAVTLIKLNDSFQSAPHDNTLIEENELTASPNQANGRQISHYRTESVSRHSPAKVGTPGSAIANRDYSSTGMGRRSSDSDLSITPKGNSLNSGEKTATAIIRTGILVKPHVNHDTLDMLEYPFLTLSKFPPGFIIHLGATVTARSVKLLERVPNPDEPETRDSWWNELRMEIRSHARAICCNVVLGYTEQTTISEDVCVLTAYGTAALINLQYTGEIVGLETNSHKNQDGQENDRDLSNGIKDLKLNSKNNENSTAKNSDTSEGENGSSNGVKETTPAIPNVTTHANLNCSVCHIPYGNRSAPFRTNTIKCYVCKRGRVPDVLLCSIEMPEGLQVTGRGCLLQAHICRPKRDLRSELNAKEISDSLPFLEYELHKLLISKLKMKGMNAIFGLKTSVAIGERMLALLATGTATYVTALPPPLVPTIVPGNQWSDTEKLQELQKSIQDAVEKNREIYQLKTLQEYEMSNKLLNPNEDTDDSDDDMTDLDLTIGNKEACVLEIDDLQDLELISMLHEPSPPEGFHVVNTQMIPGLYDMEIVRNLQMFTQVWRAKIPSTQPNIAFAKHFQRLLQTIYFKLRSMIPCAICDIKFRLDLPETDDIQLLVTGMALGLGEPNKINKMKRKTAIVHSNREASRKNDEDLIFNLEEDQGSDSNTAIPSQNLLQTGSLKSRKKSPPRVRLASLRLPRHVPLRERYGVDITPLSYVPGGKIDKYLGNLNFFFIRESTSVRENGGISGFVHSFITEVLAVIRAHVTALGGNAMVAFYMTELNLVDNMHKNQGQCLISVGGDVVFVSYFNED